MQNELKSPRDGVVVSINVKAGDTVDAGDVLAVVE
jgi:biotin carboxyl carrier protein